jgi:hypothetical protein
VSQRPGSEAQDDGQARLPVVARWGELLKDRRREEVEAAIRSPLGRLTAGLRSASSLPSRGRQWLRLRALQPRRGIARRRAQPPRPSAEDWLVPILVDCFGRDGSTLMMRLLASSPEIALGTRYPFEQRYFTYLWRWSRLLDRGDWPRDVWGTNEVCSVSQEDRLPLLGPPPWTPRYLIEESGDGQPMSRRCFELVWREFSRRASESTSSRHRSGRVQARYYAEKHLDTWKLRLDELPPVKLMALLRDPRDVWVSVQAFERKRPAGANFRAGGTVSEVDLLRYQIARQRERLRWIAGLLEDGESPVVRYEELVLDLPAVASRIGGWLGVSLDAEGVGGRDRMFSRHASAATPADSIGRWQDELEPGVAELFTKGLGPELRALGFAA